MRTRIAPIVLIALLGQSTATKLHHRKSAILAQQDTETEVKSEEVPKTIPIASLESLIPFPPTEDDTIVEEPSLEEDLAAHGGSHAARQSSTENAEQEEEEAEASSIDINNIDIAALGESLGLDPSNSRIRRRKGEDCRDVRSPAKRVSKRGYYPDEDYYTTN